MAIHSVYPEHYQQQLTNKIDKLQQEFAQFSTPDIEVFASSPQHYRMRAEFKIWQEQGRAHYAMYKPGEYKKPFIIDEFAMGSKRINQLMTPLLDAINRSETLRQRLFQVEFLTTLSGDALITLIYHKPLDDAWLACARELKVQLEVDLIGRSRKQKMPVDRDYVIEKLQVAGKTYTYQQVESSFTQPNGRVCEKMLAWALDVTQPLTGDLLELYCGNGNFTIPLAGHFTRVLATEVAKTSVKSALYNLQINNVNNVAIVRLASEELCQALDKIRRFRRLRDINIDSYNFTTVFVDPPRAGLDCHTIEMVTKFDNILYISCNQETLKSNLESISKTHKIQRFAAFDQFPYTPHLECGVLLQRKS